ncbi:dnaJ homolog subfamily C member 30, mitochondrial-like [Phymastichus coffea]|uniref:dnaJ homolog subfamily C member 30, mitochondrial-like n=1 Tax=Phymastichus coffea TaxID=108790 RepID=UPI00273AB95A|nr:dnaJ homolog subfamily C member 30, mitochondrial-like [Phymastichus coffea]XP_058807022.1 dnaJ homolog subfamily C member 30, mitochondrial-like [Phymastichus coffea]
MNRSRPILNSIHEVKLYMCTKTRIPTHYETLKIKPDCTQDDIKSAYYELSKQYHPDKNKSTDAKIQFQSVSDAYEILGNFSKRKQYDRDLAARGQRASIVNRPVHEAKEDPLAAFYRSRMSNYDHVRAQEARAHFDFETWTKAHYGQTLRRTLKDKRSKIIRQQMQLRAEQQRVQDKHSAIFVSIAMFLICSGLIIQHHTISEYDENLIKKQQNSDKKS